ncbi:MAG: formate dehydrogenase accessory sulfurtransferase FdhD [Steroidobacteraceae bacterium]
MSALSDRTSIAGIGGSNGAAGLAPIRTVGVQRWDAHGTVATTDQVAEEAPIALIFHSVPHVVMLATPADLEDFAIGFTLSEALVAEASEIRGVEVETGPQAIDVRITIASERFAALLQQRRNLLGRTGCGLCGAETLEQAVRVPRQLAGGVKVSVEELHRALAELSSRQPLNQRAGSVHAAAWAVPGRGVQYVREDVGRHNALDKLIGALVRDKVDRSTGFAIITSRASYEMVLKSATVGITFLAAVSAPTAFAIRVAEQAGLTLVGFARADQHVVYAHGARLLA